MRNDLKGMMTQVYGHSSVKLGSKTSHSIGKLAIPEKHKQIQGEYHENQNTIPTNNN